MTVAGVLKGPVKRLRFVVFGKHRGHITATPKPCLGCHQKPCIEMHRGNMGGTRVGHQRNPRGPKVPRFLGPRNVGPEFGAEGSMHRGNVHPHFFKNTPALHHGHHAAPPARTIPRGRAKLSGRSKGGVAFILQRFIAGAQMIPQLSKPRRGHIFLLGQGEGRGPIGKIHKNHCA